jgi:hypothetical protein
MTDENNSARDLFGSSISDETKDDRRITRAQDAFSKAQERQANSWWRNQNLSWAERYDPLGRDEMEKAFPDENDRRQAYSGARE